MIGLNMLFLLINLMSIIMMSIRSSSLMVAVK